MGWGVTVDGTDGESERIDLLLTLSRYAVAEREARALIGRWPDGWLGYTQLARALACRGRHEPAIQAAEEGVRRGPGEAYAHLVLGRIRLQAGRPRAALRSAREAARLGPGWPAALDLLSDVFNRLGRPNDGLTAARDGLRHDPKSEDLIVSKAWSELGLGRGRSALRTALDGLADHPNSWTLRNVIGAIHLDQTRWCLWPPRRLAVHRRAEEAFRDAIRLRPGEESLHRNRRLNLVRWRSYLVRWVLSVAIVLSAATGIAVGAAVGAPDWGFEIVLEGALLALGGAAVALLAAAEGLDGFLLRAPFGRFGVPTVQLPHRSRWAADAIWVLVVLGLLAPVGIALYSAAYPDALPPPPPPKARGAR